MTSTKNAAGHSAHGRMVLKKSDNKIVTESPKIDTGVSCVSDCGRIVMTADTHKHRHIGDGRKETRDALANDGERIEKLRRFPDRN